MRAEEVRNLLRQLQRGIRQSAVALQCHCSNLETVYVSLTRADEVLVSDQGETFAYLARGTDSTYRQVQDLDMAAAVEACWHSGAILRCDEPDAYPRIECVVLPTGSVHEAIERVAEAVEGMFQLALRDDLK